MSRRRKPGRRIGHDGRSKLSAPFVMLPHYVMDSTAYRSLKPGPRALLLELIRRFNGFNNGRIGLGLREACASLSMTDQESVGRYFAALVERGFIVCTKDAGFNMKSPIDRTAREWRLTWEPAEGLRPTKEFIDWGRNAKRN